MKLVAFSRAPALVAAFRRGFFAAEGLDVTFTRTTSSRAQLDGLLAGEFDVAHTAADNVVARVDQGADLRVVLVADRGAEHGLVGAPPIRALSELAGRRLGVDAAESGHALLAYVFLAEAGVVRGRYEVVPVGSTRERYDALVAGRIDAAMLSSPYDERALSAGCHLLASAAKRFPDHPRLTVAVKGAWASAHRTEVEAYCRALLAGARFVADPVNHDLVVLDLAADEGTSSRDAERRYGRERPERVPTLDEMRRAIEAVCAVRRLVGLASGEVDAARYFDPSFARVALAGAHG